MTRFVAISDLHMAPIGTRPAEWHNQYHFRSAARRLGRALEIAETALPDAIVILGDMAHAGDRATLDRVLPVLNAVRPSVWVVAGNHDSIESTGAVAAAFGRGSYRNVHHAETAGQIVSGLRVAGARLQAVEGIGEFEVKVPPMNAWEGEAVVWLTHYPVLSEADRFRRAHLKYPGDARNCDRLATAFSEREWPMIVISGHLHARDAVAEGAVLQIVVPALIEPPFELAVIDISGQGSRVWVRAIAVQASKAAHLPVLISRHSGWTFEHGAWRPESGPGPGGEPQ